jgi:hypothetical protein
MNLRKIIDTIATTASINLSARDSAVIGVVVMVLSAATGTDVNIGRRQSKMYHKRTKVVDDCDDLSHPDGPIRNEKAE